MQRAANDISEETPADQAKLDSLIQFLKERGGVLERDMVKRVAPQCWLEKCAFASFLPSILWLTSSSVLILSDCSFRYFNHVALFSHCSSALAVSLVSSIDSHMALLCLPPVFSISCVPMCNDFIFVSEIKTSLETRKVRSMLMSSANIFLLNLPVATGANDRCHWASLVGDFFRNSSSFFFFQLNNALFYFLSYNAMTTRWHPWTNHIGAERWQMSLGVQVFFSVFSSFFSN